VVGRCTPWDPGTPRRLVCQSARDGGCCSLCPSILVLTGGLAGLWRHCRGGAATGNVFSSLAPAPARQLWPVKLDSVMVRERIQGNLPTVLVPVGKEVLAARMWLHRAPKMAARDVMHSWILTSHLPPPRLSSHGPARFGLSPALPSVPPAPPAMPSSSVCSGNASAPSLGALKRLNVPFLFRYLRAYAWQRRPTPPLIELAEIDQLMVGIKISTSPATHTSPLPQSI
jgi:hypothetical protein